MLVLQILHDFEKSHRALNQDKLLILNLENVLPAHRILCWHHSIIIAIHYKYRMFYA